MELLKSFKFVKKVTTITDVKANLIQDLKESVEELKLVREGKLKGIPAKDLLNEI